MLCRTSEYTFLVHAPLSGTPSKAKWGTDDLNGYSARTLYHSTRWSSRSRLVLILYLLPCMTSSIGLIFKAYTRREENAAVMCAGRSRAVFLRKCSIWHSSASSSRSQNVRAHISASRRAHTVRTKQSCVRTNEGFIQTQSYCVHALHCFVLNSFWVTKRLHIKLWKLVR